MCGSLSKRFSRSSFILCFFLLASSLAAASPDVAQMTDAQLGSELRRNLQLQQSLRLSLDSGLTSLQQGLEDSQQMAQEALEKSQMLSTSLEDVQRDLLTYQGRLDELESQALTASGSLTSTTSSLTVLSSSLTSYYEETEAQVKSLKRQNILWIVLTVAASALAVTALVID